MERLHVFVDEYGDPNLDVGLSGVSAAYIVAAVCVRDRALDRTIADASAIRKKHFQLGEMKSSSVGSNDGRRLQLVRDLSKLDVFVIAFCANKAALDKQSGLGFKKSFIKYFANALYQRVVRCADDLQIVIDEHGSDQFQKELRSYLEGRYSHDLFSATRFTFDGSERNVLLQVADVYAGSLARIHDEKKLAVQHEALSHALADRVSLTRWPSGREEGAIPPQEHGQENNERIRRYCLRRAEEYLDSVGESPDDRDERARAIFLDSLLAHHSLGETGTFLSTPVLKREISYRLGETISDHRFRSGVVAKLRDAGVIISSCSKGYRIPSTIGDMQEFAAFANSQIPPMVARLGRARKGIREATLGHVDILAGVDLAQLKSIVEHIEPWKASQRSQGKRSAFGAFTEVMTRHSGCDQPS